MRLFVPFVRGSQAKIIICSAMGQRTHVVEAVEAAKTLSLNLEPAKIIEVANAVPKLNVKSKGKKVKLNIK